MMPNIFSIQRFVVVAVSFAVLVSGQQAACARNYTVQPGDFCDKISAAQNSSTFQLASVNSAIIDSACDNLQVGEVLCLGLVGQDCTKVHVVASGDACGTIASQAEINTTVLLANNPNVNAACSNIYPGEVLCVGPTA